MFHSERSDHESEKHTHTHNRKKCNGYRDRKRKRNRERGEMKSKYDKSHHRLCVKKFIIATIEIGR